MSERVQAVDRSPHGSLQLESGKDAKAYTNIQKQETILDKIEDRVRQRCIKKCRALACEFY